MERLIVFHIAWMAEYDGDDGNFNPGGFNHAFNNGYGHEALNFRAIDGYCYGYVPLKRTKNLRLEKHFDVDKDADSIDGVTVVWTATHPEQGGRAVVGVWRHATVYRERQVPPDRIADLRRITPDAAPASYRCKAKAEDCLLLPPDARPIFVPAGQPRNGESWPGQQPVFYPQPGSTAHTRLLEILERIEPVGGAGSRRDTARGNPSGWQIDVERRMRIEKAAVKAVWSKLEDDGFDLESVERDDRGFDLVATRGEEVLHVEVKGRSGPDVCADLTINEYKCLLKYVRQRTPAAHYRIAIVTNALTSPVVHEFALVARRPARWLTLDGTMELDFQERIAAHVTATPAAGREEDRGRDGPRGRARRRA